MIVRIRKIGNSQGVLIPKSLLTQCSIEENAVVEVKDHKIVISPFEHEKRKGWEDAFKKMSEAGDDKAEFPDLFPDEDLEEWT